MDNPDLWLLLVLFCVAFFAGAVDAIAGGGGLIVMPALLLAGVPPLQALGTNKFQGLFGTGAATYFFARGGYIDLGRQWPAALASFAASVTGAMVASMLPSDWLATAMPLVLIAIAIYFVLKPEADDLERRQLVGPAMLGFAIVPLIGFYDGIFGPGAGSLFMLALVALGGMRILQATAQTKLFNCASNIGGFVSYALLGAVIWKIGLIMALGQIAGGTAGARLAVKGGKGLIRPLLVTVCIAMALRLYLA